MADTRTLTIRISVDNARAVASIKNLSTSLQNLLKNQTAGGGQSGPLGQMAGQANRATTAVAGMGRAAKKSASEFEVLDKKLADIQAQGGRTGAIAARLRKQLSDATKPLGGDATVVFDRVLRKMAQLESAQRRLNAKSGDLKPNVVQSQKMAYASLRNDIKAIVNETETRLSRIQWGPSKEARTAFRIYSQDSRDALKNVEVQYQRLIDLKTQFAKKENGVTKDDIKEQARVLEEASRYFERSLVNLQNAGNAKVQSALNNAPQATPSGALLAQASSVGINYAAANTSQAQFLTSGGRVVTMLQNQASGLYRTVDGLALHQQAMDRARRSAYAYTIAGYQLQSTLGQVQQFTQETAKTFADFDFTARRAAGAFSVFDTAGQTFNDLSSSIQDTAIATKMFNPKEVAQGYYFWGSTTGQVVQSQDDLLNIQRQVIPIMQAAAITQTDLESSLKGVYSILQQYGKPMEDAEAVTQKLFLVTQKTAVEFPDLIESFKMVGPIAASIGVSFEDVVGMLGALGNAGVRGSMAGRALRQTFVKLTDPTVRASKALDEAAGATYGLGTSFQELIFPEGQFIGMQGYLDVLTKMTRDMTQEQRNNLLGIMTTQNELPALIKLLDANAESYSKNSKGIIEFQNAQYGAANAARSFGGAVKNQIESPAATYAQFATTLNSIVIEIGRGISDIVLPVLKAFQPVLEAVLKVFQNVAVVRIFTGAVLILAGALAVLASKTLISYGAFKLLRDVIIPGNQAFAVAAQKVLNLASALGIISKQQATASSLFTNLNNASNDSTAALNGTAAAATLAGSRIGKAAVSLGRFAKSPYGIAVAVAALVGYAGVSRLAERNSERLHKVATGLKREGNALSYTFGVLAENVAEFSEEPMEWLNKRLGEALNLFADVSAEIVKMALYQSGLIIPITIVTTYIEKKNAESAARATAMQPTFASHSADERTDRFAAEKAAARYADLAAIAADNFNSNLRTNMAKKIGPSLISAFKSGDAAVATAAADSAKWFIDTMSKKIGEASGDNVLQGLAGLGDAAANLMSSDNKWATRLGAAFNGSIATALATGNQLAVKPAVNKLLTTIGEQFRSGSKKNKEDGRAGLASLLNGFTSLETLNTEQITQLGTALALLATPGMEQAGFDLAYKFLTSLGLTVNEGVKRIANGVNKYAKDAGSEYDNFGRTQTTKKPEAFNLENILGRPTDDTAGSGSQQSPLEKALDVARQAADLAENLQKVAGKDIKAMVKSSMGKIASAILLADNITYDITKSFSKAKLTKVAEFSDASSKVMSLISAAVDAFDKARKFKEVPKASFKSLKANIIDAVRSIEDAASAFKDANLFAKASVFAESAGTIIDLLGKALDVFAKMPTSYARTPQKIWDEVALDIAGVINAVRRASKKVHTELLPEIENFATSAATIVGAVGTALDTLDKASSMGSYERQPVEMWDNITLDIASMVNSMRRASRGVKAELLPEIEAFAKSANEVSNSVGSALSVFANIPRAIDIPDGSIFTPISERIASMATALGKAAENVDAQLLNQAKYFAGKVGPVVTVIGDAVAALTALANFAAPDKFQIDAVVESIRLVMESMFETIQKSKFKPAQLKQITDFSAAATSAVNAVKAAADAFAEKVVDEVGEGQKMSGPLPIVEIVKQMGLTMDAVLKETERFANADFTAIKSMAEAAKTVVETVKTFYETMSPQDLGTEGANEMIKNISESIKIVLATIKSSLDPFVNGFRVTGGDIVKNLASGMREQKSEFNTEVLGLIAALNQVSAINSQLQAQLIVTQSLMVTVQHVFGTGVSNMTAAQMSQIVNAGNDAIGRALLGTRP